jgi:hypothetical protein
LIILYGLCAWKRNRFTFSFMPTTYRDISDYYRVLHHVTDFHPSSYALATQETSFKKDQAEPGLGIRDPYTLSLAYLLR